MFNLLQKRKPQEESEDETENEDIIRLSEHPEYGDLPVKLKNKGLKEGEESEPKRECSFQGQYDEDEEGNKCFECLLISKEDYVCNRWICPFWNNH